MANEKTRLTRNDLAKFLPDQRAIKAFENLFIDVSDNQNSNSSEIDKLSISAGNAESSSILALALIQSINKLVEIQSTNPITIDEKPNQIDLLKPENRQPSFDYIDIDALNQQGYKHARVSWSIIDDTLSIGHSGGVTQQVGEELYARPVNTTGTTITNGTLVGLTGVGAATTRYIADGSSPPIYAIGLATQDILNGERGRVTTYGRVRGIDTSAFTTGQIYASATVAGGLTQTKPTAPNLSIPIGVVTIVSATAGEIFVRPVLDQQLYYGAFAKTSGATPAAANTAYTITLDSTIETNGVSIGTPTSRIVASNSGLYSFNVSFQLTSTNASTKNVYLWFRKNGVDVPNSTIIRSLESASAVTVQSRSAFFKMLAGDYIELVWASDNVNVMLDARSATAFAPSAPAVLLTVDQIQQ